MSICVSLASLIRDPLYNVHLNKFQVALSYSGLNFNFWSLAETRLMKHTTRLFGSLCCSSKPLQIWLEIRIPAERQWRQSQKCLDTRCIFWNLKIHFVTAFLLTQYQGVHFQGTHRCHVHWNFQLKAFRTKIMGMQFTQFIARRSLSISRCERDKPITYQRARCPKTVTGIEFLL